MLPDNVAMNSEWLNFSLTFDLRVFPEARLLCQPMDSVCSCFDLTDSKVLSTPLSLRKLESSQAFCRCGAHFKCVPKLLKAVGTFISPTVPLYPPALNSLSPFGRIFMKFEIFLTLENLLRKFKSH